MNSIKSLQEKLGQNAEAMKSFYEKAEKDGRELLNADEQKQFDALVEESNGLEKKLNDLQHAEKVAADNASIIENNTTKEPTQEEAAEAYSKAFHKMVRWGIGALDMNEQKMLQGGFTKAQSSTGSEGGYTIPQGFANEIDKQLAAYGGIRSIARVMPTGEGNNVKFPTINDTSNVGQAEGENDAVATTDFVFGEKDLDSYIWSSDQVLMPWSLMEDSYFNLESLGGELLGERYARGTSNQYVNGTGSSAPQGITGAATEASGLASGTTSLSADDVLDIKHSVDPAYRFNGKFLFADSTLKELKKLSVGTGDARPLWQPGLAFDAPSTIDGDEYAVDQNVADYGTAGNKFMFYGDFSKFIIREVGERKLVVLRERYAEKMQTGMFVYGRIDSELMNSNAVVYGYYAAT